MREISIRLNKESGAEQVDVCLPTAWNELNKRQLLYIATYWQSWNDLLRLQEDMIKARAMLFLVLCGLKKKSDYTKLCNFLSFVDEETSVNVLDFTDFVFKDIALTKNLLPKLWVGGLKCFYGPQDNLTDLSIDEFAFCFDAYQKYSKTKDENDLNNLVFNLYRPKNKNIKISGDTRVLFNHKIDNTHLSRNVRYAESQAIYLFFYGCVEYLRQVFPKIFQYSEEKQRKAGGTFLDATIAMSGGKFGSFNETKEMNIYIFFKELQEQIIESERIKNELKK